MHRWVHTWGTHWECAVVAMAIDLRGPCCVGVKSSPGFRGDHKAVSSANKYNCLDGFIWIMGQLLYCQSYAWSLENRVKEMRLKAKRPRVCPAIKVRTESPEVAKGHGWISSLLGREAAQSHSWMARRAKKASSIKDEVRFQRDGPLCCTLCSSRWQKMLWGRDDDNTLSYKKWGSRDRLL